MRFETAYTLTLFSKLPQNIFPFNLELDGTEFEIRELEEDWQRFIAYVNGLVNPDTLVIRKTPTSRWKRTSRGIDVPERISFYDVLIRSVNILSFLTDVPMRYAHNLENDLLIPETPEDQQLLDALGTKSLYISLHGDLYARSFSYVNLPTHVLNMLDTKKLGLHLYSKALLMQEPYAIFREFWKILKSAFGTKDRELLSLLLEYPVVQELSFTEEELNQLWVLRGRASHAESRKGMKEYQYVVSETNKSLHRIKCLVEQVILTMKDWGSKSCDVERLSRMTVIIDNDGKLTIYKGS